MKNMLSLLGMLFLATRLLSQSVYMDSKLLYDASANCIKESDLKDLKIRYGNEVIDQTIRKYSIVTCPKKSREPASVEEMDLLIKGIDYFDIPAVSEMVSSFSNPSALIDKSSQFLVERTKEELNIAFIEKLRTVFKNTELNYFFPNVSMVVLYNDPLNFSTWGDQLKIAIKADIEQLPEGALNFLEKETQLTNSLQVLKTALTGINYLKSGISPASTIQLLDNQFGFQNGANIQINAQTLSLLNVTCQSFSYDSRFIGFDKIVAINESTVFQDIFITLFLVKNKQLLSSVKLKDQTLYEILSSNDQVKYQFITQAGQISLHFAKAKNAISELGKSTVTDSAKTTYAKELNSSLFNLFEQAYKIYYLGHPELITSNNSWFTKYRPLIKSGVDINNYLLDHDYKAAMFSFTNMMILNLKDAISNYDESTDIESIKRYRNLSKGIVYWGGFLTEFISLDSAQNFSSLLSKYAEPVGSYRIKRQSLVSLSVNAYPGLFLGGETLNSTKFASGITAPIGLSLNWARRDEGNKNDFDFTYAKKAKSYGKYKGVVCGVYASLIDIGAPFVYRWSADSTKGFPTELKWADVFAPGLFFVRGSKNSGLTFMAGVQMAPALKKVTETSTELTQNRIRFGVTVTYDIPLFTLVRKTQKD